MAVNLSRTFTTHPSPLDQRLRMQEHQQRMAAAAKVATKARAAEDPQATAAILADDPLPEECDCGGADARDVAQSMRFYRARPAHGRSTIFQRRRAAVMGGV